MNYDITTLDEKRKCKLALQKELGLPQRPDVPMVGFIGRLDWQKGPELIAEGIDRLMGQDIQLVRKIGAAQPPALCFGPACEPPTPQGFFPQPCACLLGSLRRLSVACRAAAEQRRRLGCAR